MHHETVLAMVRDAKSEKRTEELIQAGSEFLAECLSPYEMAHRGFQDAVKALRQLNETLEEEIKRIASQRGKPDSETARMLMDWGIEAHRAREAALLRRRYDAGPPVDERG